MHENGWGVEEPLVSCLSLWEVAVLDGSTVPGREIVVGSHSINHILEPNSEGISRRQKVSSPFLSSPRDSGTE